MNFPPALQYAIDRELESLERSKVARAVAQVTSDYKAGQFKGSISSAESRGAYLATRVPATYAANFRVFSEIARYAPEFKPSNFLDLGAGPGTASWAASNVWPGLSQFSLVESNPEMIEVGRRIAKSNPLLETAIWIPADLRDGRFPPADLVVLSYTIGELTAVHDVVAAAWAATRNLLVVIEPGTPRNFQAVAQIRRELISGGGHVAGPCPHHHVCPMWEAGDWCHFAVRLERSSLHRRLKGGDLGYEDEKFSYIVFSKNPVSRAASRIIRHPETHSGFIRLQLCTPSGLQQQTVTRSQKPAFRAARRSKWGDEWNQFE